jgi:hypothetical protein
MKIVFSIMALCLSACASKPIPRGNLSSYGDPGPGTIHVFVRRRGFDHPGHYYLPKGTTLGSLIDRAGWKLESGFILFGAAWYLSGPGERFLMVEHNRGRGDKNNYYTSYLDKKGRPFQHRERLMHDGDQVFLSGISF